MWRCANAPQPHDCISFFLTFPLSVSRFIIHSGGYSAFSLSTSLIFIAALLSGFSSLFSASHVLIAHAFFIFQVKKLSFPWKGEAFFSPPYDEGYLINCYTKHITNSTAILSARCANHLYFYHFYHVLRLKEHIHCGAAAHLSAHQKEKTEKKTEVTCAAQLVFCR